MSVISRSALESSSLADLHEIASELGLDGFRRLRKADLVGAIIDARHQRRWAAA
jgi:transcription termination factor Rho